MELQSSLERDYDRILGLVQQLEDTSVTEPERREELLYELRVEVEAHNRAEERVLFPLLLRDKAAHDAVIRARQENHGNETLLAELKAMPNDDRDFAHKVRVLSSGLREHAAFDREAVLARLRSFISEDQEPMLLERIDEERKRTRDDVHDHS